MKRLWTVGVLLVLLGGCAAQLSERQKDDGVAGIAGEGSGVTSAPAEGEGTAVPDERKAARVEALAQCAQKDLQSEDFRRRSRETYSQGEELALEVGRLDVAIAELHERYNSLSAKGEYAAALLVIEKAIKLTRESRILWGRIADLRREANVLLGKSSALHAECTELLRSLE
jgi:hypothetical protein